MIQDTAGSTLVEVYMTRGIIKLFSLWDKRFKGDLNAERN